MQITIDASLPTNPFDHFWCSMGFTPAAWLLEPVMQQTIVQVGAIPHRGVRYARLHFLLDLVSGEDLLGDDPQYDWSRLDRGLDLLVDNRLQPFFELMGNPGEVFTDLEDPRQIAAWQRLVAALARHCIDRYGSEEVRGWFFETWNEPDLPWWKHSDTAFLRYYDACSQGLKDVDPDLRFGGPGTCETLHPLFTGLMAHIDTGHCHLTGEPVRCDFISVHEKGGKWSKEAVTPRADLIIDQTKTIAGWLRDHHPRLTHVPLFNDECDPLIGWKQHHSWRGQPYYAAFLCRLIDRHRRELRETAGIPFAFLSSDNGFLGSWGHRSQLTCFGDGSEGLESDRFELIKKPVLTVMGLLALLGDEAWPLATDDPAIGGFATRRDEQFAILLYHNVDRVACSGDRAIELSLRQLPGSRYRLAHYRIDEEHGNPFRVWEDHGYPDDPSKDPAEAVWPDRPDMGLYGKMRAEQEAPLYEPLRDVVPVDAGIELHCTLPMHSVSLLLLTPDPGNPPGPVTGLRATPYAGRTPEEHRLLRWQPLPDRHIDSYEVAYAPQATGPFTNVIGEHLLAAAFYHSREPTAEGRYRVRARDYWGRTGPWSETLRA